MFRRNVSTGCHGWLVEGTFLYQVPPICNLVAQDHQQQKPDGKIVYVYWGQDLHAWKVIDKDVEGTQRIVRNNPSKLWTKHPNSTKTCPCPSLRIHLCKPNASDTISMFSAVGEHGTKKRVCAWPGVFTVTQRTNFVFSRLQQQNDKLKKMLQKNNQKLTQNLEK